MGNIEFDFWKAALADKQLQDVHRNMDRLLNENMERMIDEIGYGWRNEEGRYFMTKLQGLREKMQNTSLLIQKAEHSVNEAIQTAVHTEEQIKEITWTRK